MNKLDMYSSRNYNGAHKYLQHSKSKANPLSVTKMYFKFLPCFDGGNRSNHQNPLPSVKIEKEKMSMSW
jgi:hypothetical protein